MNEPLSRWVLRGLLLLGAMLPSGAVRAQSQPLDSGGVVWSGALGVRSHYNSDFPSSVEGGAAWTGRGLTHVFVPDATLGWRWISLRFAPELWQTENRRIQLVAAYEATTNPFADPMRPSSIDLPQSLGVGAAGRLDPGQSSVAVTAFGFRSSLTSASRGIGAGGSHALLMSPDAPGFPRFEIGNAVPLRLPLGDVAFTLAAGQVGQTRWAPARRTGSRSVSFFEARWRPLRNDRLEIGGARLYHRDWQGIRLGDLLTPFGSLFFDAQTFAQGTPDNQLLAVFGRVVEPRSGVELRAEFGLNDRQTDARELAVELEHNSAWLFSLRREWDGRAGERWSVEATSASGRIPPIQVFRGQATFYEHAPITQGHTNRGHLLGSRLLERLGGAEIRVDRRNARHSAVVVIGTRDLANQRQLSVDENRLRREWSLITEWTFRRSRQLEWWARVGGIADLNRHPVHGDAYSAILGTGVTWRPWP